ncbi:MAG: hypothetical protein KBS81_04635 [Spirochaetales bacterium]|nr:hypothetical protein [Candidatus Physcosoma equi]
MKRRTVLITILSLILLVGGCGLVAFFRPLVVYVEPNVPQVVVDRFSYPSFYGKGYWSLHLKEATLKKISSIKKPTLVIYSPLSAVDNAYDRTLQWGTRNSDAKISLVLDEDTLWKDMMEKLGDHPVGILYERFDTHDANVFSSLEKDYPNLVRVVYEGRINNINRAEILEELDTLYAVLVPTPLEKEDVLRKTKARVVVDEREAVSFVTMDRVISAAIDWDQIVPMALLMEEVELKAHYTLSVLH